MATCNVNTLMRDASCFTCLPPGYYYPIKLALLARWLKSLNPTADTSVQGLMNQGQCFSCLPPGQWYPLRLALLCRILNGGGGGGTPCTVPDPLGPLGILSSNQGTVCFTVGVPIPPPASIIISYGTTNGGPYPTSVTFPVPGPICISGLASGVTYYFVAQGSNGPNCTTAATNQVSYTPPAPPSPDVPVDFTIDLSSASDDVLLTWTDPETPDHFQIWVNINNAGYNLLTTVAGNVLSYHDHTGMAFEDLWCYKIRAETGGVFSSFSAEVCILDGRGSAFGAEPAVVDYPTVILDLGIFQCDNSATITQFLAPVLVSVTGAVDFDTCPLLTTVDFSQLQIINSGDFNGGTSGITTLSLPALVTIQGLVDLSSCLSMTAADFPALTTVAGLINFNGSTSLVSVSFALLATGATSIDFTGCTALTTISMPSLTSTSDTLTLDNTNSLGAVSFPALTSIGNIFSLQSSGITSLSMPNLVTLNGDLLAAGSSSLTSFNAPNWIITNGKTIDFTGGPALSAASINQILHRGVVSGVTTCSFLLDGFNDAPTGQGILDAATLSGLGNTVNTN